MECTLGCQYISVTLYLLQTYPSGKPLFKGQGPVNLTYGNKVYSNFRGLNVPEDDIECKSFTVMSIDSLLVYENKYYLQVYLNNCPYKIANKQMTDYLDDNLF